RSTPAPYRPDASIRRVYPSTLVPRPDNGRHDRTPLAHTSPRSGPEVPGTSRNRSRSALGGHGSRRRGRLPGPGTYAVRVNAEDHAFAAGFQSAARVARAV